MKPGIYQGISNADYHGGKGVSKSELDIIDRSPAHYSHSLTAEREQKACFSIGDEAHRMTLEPDEAHSYILAPTRARRSNADREAWAEWFTANGAAIDTSQAASTWDDAYYKATGRYLLNSEQVAEIENMRDSVMSHPAASELLTGGVAEQSAYWIDEETGLLCRCRPDYHRGPFLVDLKTADDASPRAFARSVAKFRYHVQAAYYADGFNAAGGAVDEFVFVAVEKSPPYAVAVYYLDDDGVQRGRDAYRENLATMKACMESEKWQAFSDEPQLLEVPAWV